MPAGPGGLPVSRTGGWSCELAVSAGCLQVQVGCRSAGWKAGRMSWRCLHGRRSGGLPVSRTEGWSRELAGSAGCLQGQVGCRSAGREPGRVSWGAVSDETLCV
jgi:hypothetical protein